MPRPYYKVVDGVRSEMTEEEMDARDAERDAHDLDLTETRRSRDSRLGASDWTHTTDSQLSDADKALWATYRQELRDYPSLSDRKSTLPEWPKTPTKVAAGQAAYDAKIADGTLTSEETDAGFTLEQAAENARTNAENATT
tara:strand:- start:1099 stop:1521 length:423 start_codon:yes stop_codon:yes gene_type:complete